MMKVIDTSKTLADLIRQSAGTFGIIYTAGNGGSSATASHFTTDLLKIGYPSVCLSDNSAAITMIANDYGYENIFFKQLSALGKKDDLFVAISCSGRSPNILNGVNIAHQKRMITVAITGETGFTSDFVYNSPFSGYEAIEDDHLKLFHDVILELKK